MNHALSPDLVVSAGLTENRFPVTKEADIVEQALASELEALSLEEHERAIFDVHGLAAVQEEEPEMVERELRNLTEALKNIPEKDGYDLAYKMNPKFVESLHLPFLRSEFFKPTLGAEKLVSHFDMKLKLFGDGEIMGRAIRQKDLTPLDMKNLSSGFMQISPVRDASGRSIVVMTQMYGKDKEDLDSMNRVILYIGGKSVCENPQKYGMVYVIYNFDNELADLEYMKPIYRVEKSLPVKLLGGHYCYTDEKLRPFVSGLQAFIPRFDRHRFRQHFGTREEIDFKLQTFGIPSSACTIRQDGTVETRWHSEWMFAERMSEEKQEQEELAALQQQQHQAYGNDNTIEVEEEIKPERFDVLLGKSTFAREHTGNRRSLHLCEMFFDKYELANKYQKTDLAERVVRAIKDSGGRFLKDEGDDKWSEVDDLVARQKIAHSFRYLRSRNKAQASKQTKPPTAKPRRVSYKAGIQEADHSTDMVEEFDVITFKRVTPPASPFEPEEEETSHSKLQKVQRV